MEEALSCIGKMPIFSGIREEELYTLIKCCDGQMAVFEKDQWIFQAGEELGYIMVVLKGRLAIIQEDLWHQQKETIHIMPGEIFGENYASAGSKILPVGIKAAENSEVLFLDYERSLTFCTMACPFHSMMVHNLIRIMSANKGRAEENWNIYPRRLPGINCVPIYHAKLYRKAATALIYPITVRNWLTI